jgi:hypothetical protein
MIIHENPVLQPGFFINGPGAGLPGRDNKKWILFKK